jgi:ABC-type nitrate/sulfonate/bicarbonate transport system substrate-binding protein
MKSKSFRSIVGGAALAAVLVAGCGSSSSSSTATNAAASSGGGTGGVASQVSVGTQSKLSDMPLLEAQAKGYLKQHGISKVNFVSFTAPPAMMAAATQGQVDIINQTPSVLAAFNAATGGQKLRMFQPLSENAYTWIAKKGSGIPVATPADWQTTVRAWRGKTIGVPALGGAVDLLTRYLGDQVGLVADKDYSIRAIGLGAPAAAALKAGVIDVVGAEPFTASALEVAGIGQRVLDFSSGEGPSQLKDTVVAGYIAPQNTLSSKVATLRAFAAAVEEGRKALFDPANESQVVQMISQNLQVPAAIAQHYYQNGLRVFNISVNPSTDSRTIDAAVAAGLIKKPAPAPQDVFTTP